MKPLKYILSCTYKDITLLGFLFMELEGNASSTFKNAVFNVIYVKKRKQSDVTQTVEEMRMQQCCGRHALGVFNCGHIRLL